MCHYISMLKGLVRDISACGASVCCLGLSMPLESYWVRAVVHQQGRIWTLWTLSSGRGARHIS